MSNKKNPSRTTTGSYDKNGLPEDFADFVLVPTSKDNHEAVVEVVNIEYFSEENILLPIFYERLLSSKNKKHVAEEIQTLEPTKKPEDIIRDP